MNNSWKMLAVAMLAGISLQVQALETQPVQRASLVERIQLDGVIEAVHQATVSAQTSGQVRKVYFDVDDAVALGDVLVELDSTEQKARLNQAEAGLREAQAGLKDAKQNFARIEGIYKRELASQAQLDQARNQLSGAEA
ncbi:MAG: biotin/lipoyl-binding protein, partial [Pseudomonadaceae bacterium]|nr:biotin/lipoyl-binding protein [Pseudomonadaceae bacterium]